MATKWLTERQMTAWRTYVETVGDLSAALERDLADHGLTQGDYQVLVYLSEAEEHSMRMCDLALRLQLSPSGLTRRLDGLVSSGFVTREPSTEDRRVMLARLTDEGSSKLSGAAPDHVASVQRRIFERLDDDQVDAMATIFADIRDGLAS